MDSDFTVTGADDFLRLSKALKAAGDTELRKALHKGVRDAAKPVIKDIREAASRNLPRKGGLNQRMAKARTVIKAKTGQDPGVAVAMPGKQSGYNEGVIRHPVFASKGREQGKRSRRKDGTVAKYRQKSGEEARWVTQRVDGEWFDGTVEKSAPAILPEIEKALEAVANEIVRKAR